MSRRLSGRERRKCRVRSKVNGTTERPRLTVYRSARHIYAQVIDDESGRTLAAACTLSRDLVGALKEDAKTQGARKVGTLVARVCLERNIEKVVFDRNGYLYHGRVKALADAAREAGLKF